MYGLIGQWYLCVEKCKISHLEIYSIKGQVKFKGQKVTEA